MSFFRIFFLLTFLIASCKTYKPQSSFSAPTNETIQYSNIHNWAAHPDKYDPSDRTPEGDTIKKNSIGMDIFFIHPTTYTGDDKGQDQWNASINDTFLNRKTDEGTILFQASAFNLAGRIFAPRYRQAHLQAYFTNDKLSAKKAFELAYRDIKDAFEYYLANENHGNDIIIAGHSQGTNHAERLLQEYFVGKPLHDQLVVAYLIGMPILKDEFKDIPPCQDSTDVGCFVSWRTFKSGYFPPNIVSDNISVNNPLSWKTDQTYMSKEYNKGTLLWDFHKIMHHHEDAQVNNGILWANKPKFKGSFLMRMKNYHIADINFYYFNIRENAVLRASRAKKARFSK